jgi:hypothetical protein
MSAGIEGKAATRKTKQSFDRRVCVCPYCQGDGVLSKKEHGYLGWLIECADWVSKAQANIKAAQVGEKDMAAVQAAMLAAIGELGAPAKHSELTPEDREFLSRLKISPK